MGCRIGLQTGEDKAFDQWNSLRSARTGGETLKATASWGFHYKKVSAIMFEQFLADGRCHSGSPAPMQGPLEASHVLRTC